MTELVEKVSPDNTMWIPKHASSCFTMLEKGETRPIKVEQEKHSSRNAKARLTPSFYS